MEKNTIMSPAKANRLYWLGRYEDRVYMTLHIMGKCYDKMIDGHPDDYEALQGRLDTGRIYATAQDFTLGVLYDEENPSSLISSQRFAMDNAMLLREDIMSETLSYLEMSVALLKRCKEAAETNITVLQPIIDWSLAFWGSAEQRLLNHKALMLMMIGRNVENIDIHLRFGYPLRRLVLAFDSLRRYCKELPELVDAEMEEEIDRLLDAETYHPDDAACVGKLLQAVNRLVKV